MKRILMMLAMLAAVAACGDDETETCAASGEAACTADAECHTHNDPCRLNVCSSGSCIAPPVPDGQQGGCDPGQVCSSSVCVSSASQDREPRRAHPR